MAASNTIQKKKNYSGVIKTTLQFVFFASLAIFAFYYILKRSGNPGEIFTQISQIRVFPFLVSLLVVFSMSFLEGLSLFILSRQIDKSYSVEKGTLNVLTSNVIGVFNKTASTVIQAKTLAKQGLKSSRIFSIVTMNFLIYQFSLVIYSIFTFFISYPVVSDINLSIISGLKISLLSLIGLIINTGILLIILLLAFSKPLHRFVLTKVIDLLAKFRLIKNVEETRNKLALRIISYHVECERLIKNPKTSFLCGLIIIGKLFVSNCMPFLTFWVLEANKMSDLTFNFFELYCGANYLSLISVYIPSGAPEIAYQIIFGTLLGNNKHAHIVSTTGTIVWRVTTYLIPFIFGGIIYLLYRGNKDVEHAKYKTMTLYDMQIINLSEESDENLKIKDYVHNFARTINKKKSTRVLLDKEQVAESFEKIKENMINKNSVQKKNTIDSLSFDDQKGTLMKVIEDTEKLLSEKKEFDNAVEKEVRKEKIIQEKYNIKKEKRKELKEMKNDEKSLRKLQKKLGKDTSVRYDPEKGIIIKEPEIFEIKTKQNRINEKGEEVSTDYED